MKRPRVAATAAGTLCFLAALVFASPATLPEYWPHGPGSSWTYERVSVQWGGISKSAYDAVRFDVGDPIVLGSGVSVQPLVVQSAQSGGEHGDRASIHSVTSRPELLRQLAMARGGRRDLVHDLGRDPGSSGVTIHDATLLRVVEAEIAGYRNDTEARAWLYLDPDTSAGHGFDLQLVPDLADSVFLHAHIVGPADVSTPASSFSAALRVRYDIDYGWEDVVDSLGNPLGRARALTHGEMFWVPQVGPVLARETFVPQAAVQGNPPPVGIDSLFTELRLQSWSLPGTAVTPAAWSAVKRLYR
jgi:hypothetical protein